jgi:hypothetical protein
MSRYLRFNDYLTESTSQELQDQMQLAIKDLKPETVQFITNTAVKLFKKQINFIQNKDWVVTFYKGVIKVRDNMGSKQATFNGDVKKFDSYLNDVISGTKKLNAYHKGLILVLYLMQNDFKDRILFSPKDSLKKERIAIDNMNAKINKIREEVGPFSVTIRTKNGDLTFPQFVATPINVDDIAGVPRADFVLRDEGGKGVLYISHKDGNSVTGFQQYSGMTSDKNIKSHPEIEEFTKIIQEKVGSMTDMPKGTYFATPIKDPRLVSLSLFGNDFGGAFGINNCSVLFQGSIEFEPVKNTDGLMSMFATGHTIINPQLIDETVIDMKPSDDYWPALVCVKSKTINQFGVPGARFYIWPQTNIVAVKGIENFSKL